MSTRGRGGHSGFPANGRSFPTIPQKRGQVGSLATTSLTTLMAPLGPAKLIKLSVGCSGLSKLKGMSCHRIPFDQSELSISKIPPTDSRSPTRARFGQMQAAGSAPAVLAERRTCRTPDGLGFSAHSYGLGFLGAAPYEYRAPIATPRTFWAMRRICILLSMLTSYFCISITCLAQSSWFVQWFRCCDTVYNSSM